MSKTEFLRLLETTLAVDENSLAVDTDLGEMEQFDSYAIMALIALIDEEFGKSLSADDFDSITTVGSIIDIIGEDCFENEK